MASISNLRPSECVATLGNKRLTPDAQSHRVDDTIFRLTEAYTDHCLRVAGCYRNNDKYSIGMHSFKHQGSRRRLFAVKCLADTLSSAALIKEIAFTDVKLNEDGSFESVDLGAGTGVLSVGAAIAGLRHGAKRIILHLLDLEADLLDTAKKALACLGGNNIEVRTHVGDITESSTYKLFDATQTRLIVSETISEGTPPLIIKDGRVIQDDNPLGKHDHEIDPFPVVMQRLVDEIPDLPQKAKDGDIAMFPNMFNGNYAPGKKSQLRLVSSKSHQQHGLLRNIGYDFKYFQHKRIDWRW